MPEIQVPELSRKLARRFGVTGGSVAPTLAPEIVPVAIIEDLTSPLVEDTSFERYAFGFAQPTATGSQYSQAQLLNPAGSGLLITVNTIAFSAGSAGVIYLAEHDTGLTTLSSGLRWIDRRIPGGPAGQVRSVTQAGAAGTNFAAIEVGTNEAVVAPLALILGPGNGVVVRPDTVNVAISCNFGWSERGLLPAE